jgi:hypothetical protein
MENNVSNPQAWTFFADGSLPTQEDARMFLAFAQNIAKIAMSEIQLPP